MAVLEKRLGLALGQCDAYINVAGGMRIQEPSIDLAIVAAILSSYQDKVIDEHCMVFGEVGLAGEVRSVSMTQQRVDEAAKLGFSHIIIPKYNLSSLNRKKFNIELVPVRKVEEALRALFG